MKFDLNIFKLYLIHKHIFSPDNFRSFINIPALAFCGFDVVAPMPKPPKYPNSLITIADHLKKRRMDLRLFQEDVAKIIGVSTDCITYWENERSVPQIHLIPKIVKFLGYNPVKMDSNSLGSQIKKYRLEHGLSHKGMGEILEVDASTVGSWECGKFQPIKESIRKLSKLLKKK